MPLPPPLASAPKLNPWQVYQAELARYQGAPPEFQPTPPPSYEAYGKPPEAPFAGPLKMAAMIAAKKQAANLAAQSAITGQSVGGGLASSVPTVEGSFIGPTGGFIGPTAPAAENVLWGSAAPGTSIGANAAAMGAGPIAAILGATALGGMAGYDMLKGRKANLPGRVILGMATGGLSEVPGLFGWGKKSTGERQNERWQNLFESGNAPEWAFANGVNQDQGFGDKDLADPNFDPRKVWASSAMFDTFGKNWANTGTEAQREEITKQILANKLIDTKQGVSYMLDKDKANSIKAGVLAKALTAPAPRKDSPGFKDGKRINY
jgi:hypothetical protein